MLDYTDLHLWLFIDLFGEIGLALNTSRLPGIENMNQLPFPYSFSTLIKPPKIYGTWQR
jgi:hypothetical protein